MRSRLLTTLILSSVVVENSKALTGTNDCSACKNVVDTFLYGMSQTRKAHFGGGNTAWEEERLGKYQNSEVRYHDIVDYVCKAHDSFKLEKDDERKCHDFMADHEEDLEAWYFHKQNQVPDLKSWFCIEKTKTCCPDNHWGPECQPCLAPENGQVCFGHGKCDGESTRKGTGKCKCDKGYQGKLCRKCTTNYFASLQNETHVTCEKCDKSCKGGCSGPESKNCLSDCKPGWKFSPDEGCADIDECLENPCKKDNEICTNNIGNFVCNCKEGFKRENGACILDVTEPEDDDEEEDQESKDVEVQSNEEVDVAQDTDGTLPKDQESIKEDNQEVPEHSKDDYESPKLDTQVPVDAQKQGQAQDEIDTQARKDTSSSKKPKMSDEHRRKVRDHLKQVMETIENLKSGKKDKHYENQFKYQDPQVQSIMDKLNDMKGSDKKSPHDYMRKFDL